jgi:hypothetical protein
MYYNLLNHLNQKPSELELIHMEKCTLIINQSHQENE